MRGMRYEPIMLAITSYKHDGLDEPPAHRDTQDVDALARDVALDRARRRLERQQSRARGRSVPAKAVPAVDASIYANVGRYAGSLVMAVFEEIGGTQAMADWAEENPGEFYTKMFTKIVTAPKQIEVSGSITLEDAVKALDMEEGEGYTVVRDEEPATFENMADEIDPSTF